MDALKTVPLGSLILRISGDSLLVTRCGGGYMRDGWLTTQLPFLALQILQSIWALEDGTHFGGLPECQTQHEFFDGKSQWNL
jgi:hypothetical protein